MVQTIQRTKKIGGSIMVRIPREVVEIEQIHEGETVQIDVKKIKRDWFGTFKGLVHYNKETDRARYKHE